MEWISSTIINDKLNCLIVSEVNFKTITVNIDTYNTIYHLAKKENRSLSNLLDTKFRVKNLKSKKEVDNKLS